VGQFDCGRQFSSNSPSEEIQSYGLKYYVKGAADDRRYSPVIPPENNVLSTSDK
jgi:hypothetical protein